MTEVAILQQPQSLVARVADRFGVEPEKLLVTLKQTCFRSDKPITNEQMMGLLIVSQQYNLNPFTKELFAFDDKRGGIIPYVSVDGWARIINEHPQYDGMEFDWDDKQGAMSCTIHRKDRSHPTVVTEYMVECKRGTQPWQIAPRRMLRHKALMQCGRLAFGFAGIYDEDEAARIRDSGVIETPISHQRAHLKQVLSTSREHFAGMEVVEQADAPTGTLESLTAAIIAATDRDAAAEVLDRARSILGEDEFSELAANFSAAWDNV